MEPNDETKQTERHLGLRLLNLSQFLLPDSIDINSTPKIHVTIQVSFKSAYRKAFEPRRN